MDQQPTPTPPQQPNDNQQPVAYDAQGRPLYAAPPTPNPNPQTAPQFVHLSRAVEPVEQKLSPEVKARHDKSVRDFPELNLSEAEFVISAVRRHPIGLVLPIAIMAFFVVLIVSLIISYPMIVASMNLLDPPAYGSVIVTGVLLTALVLIGGYIAVWVYMNNRFFLTNESVIQEIQVSLFSRHEQTVSLVNIEDASFRQQGIIQTMFNYGSIRLSTEGDETTYRFDYVADPKQQIATLNNAVEAFKNGRPVIND
ncbi:MAG TPA: PH domain-containing protein [Candidatus Saccharimonadales bacterium]|nr:PH domain-containing protein [Candidatus Saccharimonadales bacterium]